MKRIFFKKRTAAAIRSGAMEQIPFENNGRSSTCRKSRVNFLTVENYVLQ
jgi:hypothetical protein